LHDSVSVPFYPEFHLVQSELQLNNLQVTRAPIVLVVSPLLLSHLVAETNEPNVLKISGPEQDATDAGRVQFVVQLSTKSAVLWHEQPRDCYVTITNTLTGQTSKVPVTIKLYGDAPKAAFMGMSSRISSFTYDVYFFQPWTLPVSGVSSKSYSITTTPRSSCSPASWPHSSFSTLVGGRAMQLFANTLLFQATVC
jgi:hypothetical protein